MSGFTVKPASRVFYSDHPRAILCLEVLPNKRIRFPDKWSRIVGDLFRKVSDAPLSKQNKPT